MQFCVPEAYENHDFTIPPKETLETLCKQKALNLRANNDKIVIWYSGGCDSHYVLDTFLKNNIKVDEIHMVKSGFSNADYEIEKYAIPFVKKLCKLTYCRMTLRQIVAASICKIDRVF